MKLIRLLSLPVIILFTVITAAAQTDLIKYLPENASAVISFNSSKLKQKMTWKEFTQSKLFTAITQKAPNDIKPFLTNPDSLGLDKSPEVIVVIVGDEKNSKNGYGAAFIRMKNPVQFATAIQKLFKNRPIKTIGTNKIMIDQDAVFGWNQEMLTISGVQKDKEFREAKTAKAMTIATENKFKTLTDRAIKLLTPKLNSSYSKDIRFTSLMKEDGDIRMWSTSSFKPLNDLINKKGQAMNTPANLKGGVKAAVINFEQGKLVWQTRNYPAKTIDSLYKIYPGNKINTNPAGHLPNGDVLVYLSLNYPPDLIKAIFQAAGMKDMAKGAFKDSSMKGLDFKGVFKGDISLAVVKADEFDVDDSITQNLGGLQLFVTGSIADKPKFEKIAASFKNKQDSSSMTGGKAAKFLGGLKDGLQYNDNTFVLSLSSQAATKFLKGDASSTPAWLQSYTSEPVFLSLDLKSIFALAMQMKKSNSSDQQSQEFIKSFDRLIYSGGSYSGDHINSTVEFQLTEKNENALNQLVNLLGTAVEERIRSRDAMPDTEMPPPPPPTKEKRNKN